jgi:hypothetical protein
LVILHFSVLGLRRTHATMIHATITPATIIRTFLIRSLPGTNAATQFT